MEIYGGYDAWKYTISFNYDGIAWTIDDYDSFITHHRRKADLDRARQSGMEVYNTEQMEKARILDVLLSNYNDGRKKTLFCVAVNLLELQELQAVLREIECKSDMEALSLKEKSAFVASLLQDTASRRIIDLKLHKKKWWLEYLPLYKKAEEILDRDCNFPQSQV